MRAIVVATTVVAVSVITLAPSYAQSGAQYYRCAELASRQGFSLRTTSGRRFINRCMQRGAYRGGPPREDPRCPTRDAPWARSSYPSWMCP